MANPIPSINSLLKQALDLFKNEYQTNANIAVHSPGRVNLIGEHIDYNEGFVLPMALPLVTLMVGRRNGTNSVQICSTAQNIDYPHKVKFSLDDEIKQGTPKWLNYVKGVIVEFNKAFVPGFDAVILSSVPVGGGLSSSAALEVACYTFLEALTGKKNSDNYEKSLACQKAEHVYAGVPCGFMDQLVSVLARRDHALFIDCRSKHLSYVPFQSTDTLILIINSNVKHELSGSEYSTRLLECETVCCHLQIKSLRDAKESDLITLEKNGVDKTLIARAKHVITEIKRTKEGAKALEKQDFAHFGKLMVESHNSLRYDYEVSCKELDQIVEATLEVNGVFGSRMTGGGFGGCTVTLLKAEALNKCITNVKRLYSGDPIFYVCKPSEGCGQLILELQTPSRR